MIKALLIEVGGLPPGSGHWWWYGGRGQAWGCRGGGGMRKRCEAELWVKELKCPDAEWRRRCEGAPDWLRRSEQLKGVEMMMMETMCRCVSQVEFKQASL